MNDGPVLISVAEAILRLNIGPTKFWALVRDGQLKVKKIGRRTLIEAGEIARFVDALPSR